MARTHLGDHALQRWRVAFLNTPPWSMTNSPCPPCMTLVVFAEVFAHLVGSPRCLLLHLPEEDGLGPEILGGGEMRGKHMGQCTNLN